MQRESADIEEWGQVPGIEKQCTLEEPAERTPVHGVTACCQRQCQGQHVTLVDSGDVARANSHDMCAQQPVIHDLVHAVIAEQVGQDLPGPGRYFVDVRRIAVLLVDVSLFESFYCGNRIGLRVAGETPGPDRGSDQMHRALQAWQQDFENCAVYLAQYQPFRAAGSTRDSTDQLGCETVSANQVESAGACLEDQVARRQRTTRTGDA